MTAFHPDEFAPDGPDGADSLFAEIEPDIRTKKEEPEPDSEARLVLRRREPASDPPTAPVRGDMTLRSCPTTCHRMAILDAWVTQAESLIEIAGRFGRAGQIIQFNIALGCLSVNADDLEEGIESLGGEGPANESETETFEFTVEDEDDDHGESAGPVMYLDEFEEMLSRKYEEADEKHDDWVNDFWREEYAGWPEPSPETRQRMTLDLLRRNAVCQETFSDMRNQLPIMLQEQLEKTGQMPERMEDGDPRWMATACLARCISVRHAAAYCEEQRQRLESAGDAESRALAAAYLDVMFDLACSSGWHRSELRKSGLEEDNGTMLLAEALEAHEETSRLRQRLRAEYNSGLEFAATGWGRRPSKNETARMRSVEVEPHWHTLAFPGAGSSGAGRAPYIVFEWKGCKYAKPVSGPYPAGYPPARTQAQCEELLSKLRFNESEQAQKVSEQTLDMMSLAAAEMHCVTREGLRTMMTEAVQEGVKPGTLERLIQIASEDSPVAEEHLYRLAGNRLPPVPEDRAGMILRFAGEQGLDADRLKAVAHAMRADPARHGIQETKPSRHQLEKLSTLMREAGFHPDDVKDYLEDLAE